MNTTANTSRVKWVALCAALLVIAIVGYWWSRKQDSLVEETVADLQKRSLPKDARFVNPAEMTKERFSVSSPWEIEWDGDWQSYCELLNARFYDFKIKEGGGDKVLMSKQLPGDTLSLSFEKLGEKPLRVRVLFKGYPS